MRIVEVDFQRMLGRLQLQQAEVLLNDFRSQMRSELRSQLGAGRITGQTVDLLRVQLDAVKDAVKASLRG